MGVADRVAVPGFVGGSNRLVSKNASVETSINWFPEATAPTQGAKAGSYLRPTEGLQRFAEVAGARAQLFFQDERCFACTVDSDDPGGDAGFYEIYDDGTAQFWGAVASTGRPPTMCSNGTAGNQVQIAAGGSMYCFDLVTNVFQLVDIGETIEMVEFMDGYFFALIRATRQVRYSDLEDGLTWPALSVFERSWGSDNISFIKRSGRQLWIVGNKTSEVWADTGDPDIPFAPIQGVFLDLGCVAPWSGTRDGETLMWLTQSEQGGGLVVRANGYQPSEISTHAIDLITWDNQGANSQAIMFVHQMQGHRFAWLRSVSDETTPVLDYATNLWHERRLWEPDTASWHAHLACSHAYAFEKHLVGDFTSSLIYQISPDFLTDDI